jgi:hypothetical protein
VQSRAGHETSLRSRGDPRRPPSSLKVGDPQTRTACVDACISGSSYTAETTLGTVLPAGWILTDSQKPYQASEAPPLTACAATTLAHRAILQPRFPTSLDLLRSSVCSPANSPARPRAASKWCCFPVKLHCRVLSRRKYTVHTGAFASGCGGEVLVGPAGKR